MSSIKFMIFAAVALVSSTIAQDYYIDPSTILLQTRESWCTSQESACPLLCTQLPGGSLTTAENNCDPTQLTYSCICGDGQVPNAANFSMTLPYFICTQWVQNCIAACAGQSSCQSSCTQDHPCGAQNPTRINATTTSSTTSATATGSGSSSSGPIVYSGPGTTSTSSDPASSSTPSAAQPIVAIGRSYGLAALAIGIFGGFTFFV